MLELPYIGDRFSMFIVLPNSDNGYVEVEKNLGMGGVRLFTGLYPVTYSYVQIPKWAFEQTMSSLKSILHTLGVSSAFSEDADFSRITLTEEVYISEVIHKAKINVDEEVSQSDDLIAA